MGWNAGDMSGLVLLDSMRNHLNAKLTTIIDESENDVKIHRKFLFDREDDPLEEQITEFILGDFSDEIVRDILA